MFRDMFYDLAGVKYIPDNQFLTARSLAYWLMDDGYQFVRRHSQISKHS